MIFIKELKLKPKPKLKLKLNLRENWLVAYLVFGFIMTIGNADNENDHSF